MNRARSGRLATGAIGAVARTGLRARWRRLLVLGLLAGLLGSAVVGLAVVARRTATAYDRLAAANAQEDAEVSVFGDPALADLVPDLPVVAHSTDATMFVGGLQGPGVIYLAVRAAGPESLGRPVVVEGRPADPGHPDEVTVSEDVAGALDLAPGSTLPLCLLTTQEFASFDTGFGQPDGPCVDLQVTGLARRAGSDTSTNIFTGPAFVEAYGEGTVVGRVVDVLLHGGRSGLPELTAEVEALAASSPPPPGAEEFPPAVVSSPEVTRTAAGATARVLVGGLALCAVVAALVGLLLVAQALGRQHEAEAADQRIEAALGLTPGERILARVVPALLTAGVAAAGTVVGALVAAAIEPLGPLADLEPAPGWAPNVALTVVGALLVGLTTLALAALAARRAGRPRTAPAAPGRTAGRARLLVGGPATAAGLSLALEPSRGPGRLPVRATLATVVVGIAGVTAALAFSASLDRVGSEPARWGWNGDVIVVDARSEVAEQIAGDPRVGATVWFHQVSGTLDGSSATLVSYESSDERPGWTVIEGSAPEGPDEVLLGTTLASHLGARPGDVVELGLTDGTTRPLHVRGLGIGPSADGRGIGDAALLRPEALEGAAVTGAFDELLVTAASPAERAGLIDDLAEELELDRPAPPGPVQDLLDLDRVPDLLAVYLAVAALAALANGLAVVVRRRARDLATLRAIGLAPHQVVGAVLAAALATVAVGLVIGVPLGLGVGRLVWWIVTDRVGLATDATVPALAVVLVAGGALLVAAVATTVPAWRATRLRPGELLRKD